VAVVKEKKNFLLEKLEEMDKVRMQGDEGLSDG